MIEAGDRLTGLSLGQEFTTLKTFLQRHAKKYQQQNLARTYAAFRLVSPPRVVGYIALVCGEIVIGKEDPSLVLDPDLRYDYLHYPAVKIARLAVDSSMRKRGIGSALVELALGTAQDVICPAVGCRFVVVDSKRGAVNFYERLGFTLLDTSTNRQRSEPVMFVDLHRVQTGS